MAVTDYTSYREIRSVCGLTQHDISDAMLGDPVYDSTLYLALSDIALPDTDPGPGTLLERYAEISAEAEVLRTDKEKLILVLTSLFATYVVADAVCGALPTLAAKMRSDGKTTEARFSTDLAITTTQQRVAEKVAYFRKAILNINDDHTSSYELLTVVKPAVDVVTNE